MDFFEVLSENYMDTGGRPVWVLDQVAERYPIVLHGVSMYIGSADPLDRGHLGKLKALADRTSALTGSRTISAGPAWRAATPTTCSRCP